MNLVSYTIWSLVGLLVYPEAVVVNAAGVLEIDVVFPRANETYAPMEQFPVVYALQNAKLAKHVMLNFYSSISSLSAVMADGDTCTMITISPMNPTLYTTPRTLALRGVISYSLILRR